MNNKVKRSIAAAVCCAVILGGAGSAVYAISAGREDKKTEEPQTVLTAENESEAEAVKDETVYVLAGADGSVEKIIVSDWIKNSLSASSISDNSELTNIENVRGDESYTMGGDNSKVWDAQGNDIYYQGNIEKELPVKLSVSYKLNGKSISPDELAGKSGKVTIRFDYQNNQFETVDIDGKKEKIYVPFVMLTGMLLDNDIFSNVEISNGKLINDGDHTIIAGIAFPGLQSDLNVDINKFEIPDYVEINADVENFEMTNTVTIASNEIFSRINAEDIDSADKLTDSLDELTGAVDQLMDGSSQLYDGLCTLSEKSGELISGIDKLADGAGKLKTGAYSLNSGSADLADGAKSLSDGLGQLTANSDALNSGSEEVFNSLLNMANSQLSASGITVQVLTIDNYSEVLNEVIASLDTDKIAAQARETALTKVQEAVNAQRETITAGVISAVKEQVTAKVTQTIRENVKLQILTEQGLTKESYESGIAAGLITAEQQAQIEAAIDAYMRSDNAKAMIDANVETQMQSQDIKNTVSAKTEEQIALLIDQNMNSAEVQGQITQALEQAKSGAASISALKEQLDSYNTFYTGLSQYTAGVASAKNGADALSVGADKLKSGTKDLDAGMNELYNGIITLKNGAPALVDGVNALKDGSMKLSDGLKEFNEQGVQKLVDAVDGDLNGLLARVRATADVSKNYISFSGISDDMDGQVKFIYRTESIKGE